MRLKSLDVIGFKSFLDPTVISFSPGVTAVVGPNGCGKSNVVDAIRWVLGEQAPSRLRGKSAEDLIYAGNDSNPAAGMAEVTLLLEAEEESALPEPYAALSEVAVTRRVYRSGDSEYLLNRIPCRLKDITEFFMAAQIHSRGYALIEQGRIEEIIQAKPMELRTMVEEAAGLSLFKGRREISERKLERVRENLARVDDVLKEIDRQLNFARRQAKKAEAYKAIRAELGALERLGAGRRLLELRVELAAAAARELELREAAASARGAIGETEAVAEQAGAALAAARDELAASRRERENLRAAFNERARTREFLARRLEAIALLEPDLERRLAELDLRATQARAARAEAGARLARELNGRDDDLGESALAAMRTEHQGAERLRRESERQIEECKDELSEVVREAAVTRGRLGDLSGERAELERKLALAAAELPALRAALAAARADLAQTEMALQAARDEATRREEVGRAAAEAEVAARAALDHQAGRLAAAAEELTAATARAQRIMPNGAGERLRGVLESLNGDRPAADPAMLLEVVKAPPALEPALRAVLGEQIDAVIVESPGFALRAIEILKQRQGGRLSFIPAAVAPGAVHPAIDAPGITGRLIDLVEVEPQYQGLAEALMGHVMVAEDLAAALAASHLNGAGAMFVTREGDLLWPERMIAGGSGASAADGFLDWHSGARSVEAARNAAEAARAEHQALAERLDAARAVNRAARAALEATRAQIQAAERAAGEARAAIARAEQRIALAEAGHAAAERRVAEIAATAAGSNARMEELALLEQAARARLAAAAAELAERKSAAERMAEAMLAAGAKIEARKAAIGRLEQELRHQRRIADELDAQIAQNLGARERARAERVEFQSEIEKLAAQDADAAIRRDELETAVAALADQAAAREAELDSARVALNAARAQLERLEAETVECGLRRERARTLTEELERGFAEKFGSAFDAAAGEIETALAGRDPAADETRLGELRARAEKIGEVNLAAESEVSELEQRATALAAERADLEAAVNDLTHTIQKLNREARKRFAETFAGAAKNFEELFPKLLRGGKGRLELTDPNDVLESGVNILVQPAGKKVKEIGLLSGGEKALSAMALIFSLFLLNPSPFCVMDEVDAPLDEFSLAAFTGLVRELKLRSQFIVITHNQRTMQSADHIHGVTMDRPGVSRIISLTIPNAA